MQSFDFQPVIVIGAGRSGTNMVRDLLTALPSVGTWPCDELNYMWRYGNARFPNDELTLDQVKPSTASYIRGEFVKQARRGNSQWIVEKTCANTLRVEFVHAIVPEAKFIFLVRDGWDVASSAEKRWRAPLDPVYLARKASYVPARDLPYYAARYLSHRIHKLLNRNHRLPTWGPQCQELTAWSEQMSGLEICIRQWQACVLRASESLAQLPRQQVHYVRYESFVRQPTESLSQLCDFLNIPHQQSRLATLTKAVSADSVGKGVRGESDSKFDKLETLVRQTISHVESTWDKSLALSPRAVA
jgi:Sulfotransferase family